MPREFGYEWSGLTLQQKKSEGEAGVIFGMAIVFVFLLLAAQYESWALPFAVLLCTPLVVLGTLPFSSNIAPPIITGMRLPSFRRHSFRNGWRAPVAFISATARS
jgi:multidrug efflux pump subunit AcrB